jgi:Uma2 family endonuclease
MLNWGMSNVSTLKQDLPNELLWRMSIDKYHDMIRLGILTEDDPVELLEGWLVEKMPRNPIHTFLTERTRELIEKYLPIGFFVNVQQSITTRDSEPEPDIAVIKGKREDYLRHHPFPKDCVLVIEVSDSSLKHDQGTKQRIYAVAGIAVYWIINLPERHLEVYTQPSEEQGMYKQRQIYALNDTVPLVLEGQMITHLVIRNIFPD